MKSAKPISEFSRCLQPNRIEKLALWTNPGFAYTCTYNTTITLYELQLLIMDLQPDTNTSNRLVTPTRKSQLITDLSN